MFELVLALRHNPSPDREWVVRLVALIAMLEGTVVVYLWRRTAAVESVAVLLLLLFTAMFMGTH